jgi:hypothetical protein
MLPHMERKYFALPGFSEGMQLHKILTGSSLVIFIHKLQLLIIHNMDK